MTDPRELITTLSNAAEKEATRLARTIGAVETKEELQFRVWPFLSELVEAIELLANEDDGPPTIPVDLIAQTTGLLLGLVQQLGQPVAREKVDEIAAHVGEIVEELVALVDADELAAYCAELAPLEGQGSIPSTTEEPAVPPQGVEQEDLVEAAS